MRLPTKISVLLSGMPENAAFRDFSTAQSKRANKPSIHQKLQKLRGMMKVQKKDKVRQNHQEQSR